MEVSPELFNRLLSVIERQNELLLRGEEPPFKKSEVRINQGTPLEIGKDKNFLTVYIDNSSNNVSACIQLDTDQTVFIVPQGSGLYIPIEGVETISLLSGPNTIIGRAFNRRLGESLSLIQPVQNVEFQTAQPVTINGSLPNQVTLQSNCTTAINGTTVTPPVDATITFEISGTSTSRTTVFEVAGPSGTFVSAPGYKFGDTTFTPATSTTGGTTTTPETWSVDVPANYTFRARQSAVPAGGYVNISGWWRGR